MTTIETEFTLDGVEYWVRSEVEVSIFHDVGTSSFWGTSGTTETVEVDSVRIESLAAFTYNETEQDMNVPVTDPRTLLRLRPLVEDYAESTWEDEG